MNSRDVLGKKIVRIHQTRFYDHGYNGWEYALTSIELEDGTKIYLHAHESETEPWVDATVRKPIKGGK